MLFLDIFSYFCRILILIQRNMRRLFFILSVSFLFFSCVQKSEERPAINVHVSSSVDSALVIFVSDDSVKVINYKQKNDSVKTGIHNHKSNYKNFHKNKDKSIDLEPVPSIGVPKIGTRLDPCPEF